MPSEKTSAKTDNFGRNWRISSSCGSFLNFTLGITGGYPPGMTRGLKSQLGFRIFLLIFGGLQLSRADERLSPVQ